MGLFGFGKRKKNKIKDNDESSQDHDNKNSHADAQTSVSSRSSDNGPWDIDDSNIPDEDYFDLGSLLLPQLDGLTPSSNNQPNTQVMNSVTINFQKSSLEISVLAAPKKSGIWDSMSKKLTDGSKTAHLQENGVFGTEVITTVNVNGRDIPTRIVGVDGPRWMVRGIFTGDAARDDSSDKEVLDDYLQSVVVNRGNMPLAPGDNLPLHFPVESDDEKSSSDTNKKTLPNNRDQPNGPLIQTQQTQAHETLSRGPMFSEVR